MAASFSPCASNRCFVLCSCTSCALQKGHQSAERKERTPAPVDRSPGQQAEEPRDWSAGLLAHWKDRRVRQRRGWPPQSSFWLQIRFRYLLVRVGTATPSTRDLRC